MERKYFYTFGRSISESTCSSFRRLLGSMYMEETMLKKQYEEEYICDFVGLKQLREKHSKVVLGLP